MKHEVKIPAVGESVTSGLIATWHQQNGAKVSKGDLLITLETDKIAHEITADADGTLVILSEAGTEVPVGAVVATIDDAVAAAPAAETTPAPVSPAESKTSPGPSGSAPAPVADLAQAVAPDMETPAAPPPVAEEPSASPPASPAPLPGSTSLSVVPTAGLSLPAENNTSPKAGTNGRVSRRKMSPLRRKIAEHLVAAQHNAAMLTTFNECDMSAVMDLRKQLQDSFTKKHGVKIGFMSFFIKAVVDALQAVPALNARLDGEEIVQQHYFDVGVAVSTEKGLIVPVLRDCDRMSFADIEKGLGNYAEKARSGKIGFEDLQGGVFTISNGGVFGSLLSTPILNPPQCGILGMHAIQQRPVAVDGQVVIRPMMYLAMSYDHRLVDGREAVTFLVRVKECIENPTRLLIGA